MFYIFSLIKMRLSVDNNHNFHKIKDSKLGQKILLECNL